MEFKWDLLNRRDNMSIKKRRIFIIATCLIITAITVAICVGLLNDKKKEEYDGILVESQIDEIC